MERILFSLVLILIFSGVSFAGVVIPPPPIDIDMSNSNFEVLAPNKFRIRNLTAPAYPGAYWLDFLWDPNQLIFQPTEVDVDPCANFAGTWAFAGLDDARDCGEGIISDSSDISITQNICNITITTPQRTSEASVSGNTASWSGGYLEDGGITGESSQVIISGNTIRGSSSWTWTDGSYSCSGVSYKFGIRR